MLNRSDSPEARRQQLSSLMDGDLVDGDAAGVCALWRQDAEARRDWHAYHLIGDVMRSDDLASAPARDAAFLQALRQRLADEPVPLAPAPLQTPVPQAVPQVANGAAAGRRARGRQWLMAPMAVAAGFVAVAGVMVVTRVMAPAPAAAPVMAQAERAPSAGASAVLVRDARLDRYLSAHRSLANGAMPGAGAEHRVHIVFEGQ
ncbi:sigma-E factor negative regulatory protein [Pseudaquabacterium pictum]|uniref:Anti-sigma factor n=1 Tax=Pseudaquabacterium pictum TaxID=2315236 RepID=A0A480ARG4_9BURK|nr:sigma-E factor negative regulatory protein [Rubrivivax pictus]GCL63516.1 anti-sigma factor [Rubrivivax pictus]